MMDESESYYIPDREIACNYTAAMLFAQEIESNLKAILHTIDHSVIDLENTINSEDPAKPRTFERFLDRATTGSLIEKLKTVGINWSKREWKQLNRACSIRNELAHNYLERLHLPPPTEEQLAAILIDLKDRVDSLWFAKKITRDARQKLEQLSHEQHERINQIMRRLGIPQIEINNGIWDNRNNQDLKKSR